MQSFSLLPTRVGPIIAVAALLAPVGAHAVDRPAAMGPSSRDAVRDPAVQHSAYAQPSPPDHVQQPHVSDDPRRLRLSGAVGPVAGETAHPAAARTADLLTGLGNSSVTTAVAALAFVVGLFLLFAWAVKRGMPRSSRLLPSEAVQLLGRVPLAARQFGHLLHVGNKIVLVAVTPAGIEKLVEVDDPDEVQRLVALCANEAGSSRVEFDDVFGRFAKESAPGGFLGNEAALYGSGSQTPTYAEPRGGRRHG